MSARAPLLTKSRHAALASTNLRLRSEHLKRKPLLTSLALTLLTSCTDQAPAGYIKIANSIYIEGQHRREDRKLNNGSTIRIINMNVYSETSNGGSEIIEYEILCSSGEYRFLEGKSYKNKGLKGNVTYVFTPENVFSRRHAKNGSGNEIIVKHAQNSQSICLG